MRAESGSSRKAMSALKSPARIHSPTARRWERGRRPGRGAAARRRPAVAAPTDPTPTTLTNRLPEPRAEQAVDEKARERQRRDQPEGERCVISPLEQVDLVHVDRFGVAEERHEDREADGGLRGGDGDDEEDDDLPLRAFRAPPRSRSAPGWRRSSSARSRGRWRSRCGAGALRRGRSRRAPPR